MFVRTKRYRIGKRGASGHVVSLPMTWLDDNGAKPGDIIEFFQDPEHRNCIVLRLQPREDVPVVLDWGVQTP